MAAIGNGGRRERAATMLKSAGYPGSVPQAGGKPVHFGPNAENASRRDQDKLEDDRGNPLKLANGGRAKTSGATPSSPMTPTSSDDDANGMKRGGRAKHRRAHKATPKILPPPPPAAPDSSMGAGDPSMGGGAPAPDASMGAPPAPDMTGSPPPGQQPFRRGGRTNKANPGIGAGGGLGRLRKAGLR